MTSQQALKTALLVWLLNGVEVIVSNREEHQDCGSSLATYFGITTKMIESSDAVISGTTVIVNAP